MYVYIYIYIYMYMCVCVCVCVCVCIYLGVYRSLCVMCQMHIHISLWGAPRPTATRGTAVVASGARAERREGREGSRLTPSA